MQMIQHTAARHTERHDQPAKHRNDANDANRETGNTQEDVLPCVEFHIGVFVVRLGNQKDDRRDDRDIGQCARGVV